MTYRDVEQGTFLARPNRFIARVALAGGEVICHVKNTGRLGELLLPGAGGHVQPAQNPERKTRYDLISVYKGDTLVNIDSASPNKAVAEWLPESGLIPGITGLRAEVKHGGSRFDFRADTATGTTWVEVKGVTLERDELALFPDAPTLRGQRHVEELARCVAAGGGGLVVFVVQLAGPRAFSPNDATHPAFGNALRRAAALGVRVVAMDCIVTPGGIAIREPIEVKL